MQIFTRLDKVADAVKGWNRDVMPDNTAATLQQVISLSTSSFILLCFYLKE